MGNSEDGKSCKVEKSSTPVEQTNMHVYPDWATMQAYYGPQVAVPPYFNQAVATGPPPHPYMWAAPPSMMVPYGAPYAVYPHGGVYAHPGLPLANTSLGMDTPTKSSTNSDQSLVKNLKECDGLAMTIENSNTNSAEGGASHGVSQSSGETEGSSGGSNQNSEEADQKGKKRGWEGSNSTDEDGQGNPQSGPPVVMKMSVAAADCGNKNTTDMSMSLVLKTPATPNANNNIITSKRVPTEPWLQNERELKREKRKQSNRESARRSRLRKQAEAEELAVTVESLTAENMNLKSEINKLAENSKKLKLENTAIMDKLRYRASQTESMSIDKMDDREQRHPVHTADLLAKVDNNCGSVDKNIEEKGSYENRRSEAKLYPLLGASSITDAVAAG